MLHCHTKSRNFFFNSVTRHICTIFVHFLLNAFSLYSHFDCFECQSTDGKLSLTLLGFICRLNVNFLYQIYSMHLIDFMFHLFSVRIFAMQEKCVFVYDFHLFNYSLDLIMFNILFFFAVVY